MIHHLRDSGLRLRQEQEDVTMQHGGNVWEGGEPTQWLDYSANLRPEGIPAWVRERMGRGLTDARYYPDLAMRGARSSLAAFAGVAGNCLLPTAGGIAAIDLACALAAGRVLIMPPTFGEYVRRARAHGHETAVYAGPGSRAWGDLTRGGFGPVETELRAGDTLFVCNPNNPTGEALTRDEVLALAEYARARGASLVVDEAFIDYCPELSVRAVAARGELPLIVVASLTKVLGVPGARLGYMVAGAELIERAERLALPWALNSCAACIAEGVAAHAPDIAAENGLNVKRRQSFERALSELGVHVYPSRANFLLLRFERSAEDLARQLKQQRILTRDCASFGVLDERHMRIAVKTDAENRHFVDVLRDALAEG